jgi:hypothetical protein
MAGCVPLQHDHAAIAKHISVERHGFDLAPLIQFANGAGFAFSGGLGPVSTSQSPLPISSVAFGKEPTWPM